MRSKFSVFSLQEGHFLKYRHNRSTTNRHGLGRFSWEVYEPPMSKSLPRPTTSLAVCINGLVQKMPNEVVIIPLENLNFSNSRAGYSFSRPVYMTLTYTPPSDLCGATVTRVEKFSEGRARKFTKIRSDSIHSWELWVRHSLVPSSI